MNKQTSIQAATELLANRAVGTKSHGIDASLRPKSADDAFAIQQAMIELRPDTVAGWKCLLPLANGDLIFAPIFNDTLAQGATCELLPDEGKALVEPEIVFVLNCDLPAQSADYSEQEINDAIGSCHMALELMQRRYATDADVSFNERLADCLTNQGLYIGPEIDRDSAFAAAKIELTISQSANNGEQTVQSFDGTHPNPLPQLPVYWIINYLTKRGVSFKKGEAFTTGSYAGVVELEFDQPTTITYQGIGEYTVEFKSLA